MTFDDIVAEGGSPLLGLLYTGDAQHHGIKDGVVGALILDNNRLDICRSMRLFQNLFCKFITAACAFAYNMIGAALMVRAISLMLVGEAI